MFMSKSTKSLLLLLAVTCCSLVMIEAKKESYVCKEEDRVTDFCPEIYQPVCGYQPADKSYVTYSNGCFACHDYDVKSYVEGKCCKKHN